MSNFAIRVEALSKRYRIGAPQRRHDSLRDAIAHAATAPLRNLRALRYEASAAHAATDDQVIWALRDVSLDVAHGEVLGVIGRNGAGKSTLLKVLSRVTEPTSGRAELHGRVGALLEVGTGFHGDLTGRENVFLNGSILGMDRNQIRQRFDEIVDFAGVERFIDTPVKRYSSGMYLRLAFAVAAYLEPEILVVDEVLAVGDADFQKKCLGRMERVASDGRTVLFVSHNMGAVTTLCGRALSLAGGRVSEIGPAARVVANYLREPKSVGEIDLNTFRLPGLGVEARFEYVKLQSLDGATVMFRQPLRFTLHVAATIQQRDLSVGVSLFDYAGVCVGTAFTREKFSLKAGASVSLQLAIDNLPLAPGRYYAGFSVGRGGRESARHDLDIVIGTPAFDVVAVADDGGDSIVSWDPRWGHLVLTDTRLELQE